MIASPILLYLSLAGADIWSSKGKPELNPWPRSVGMPAAKALSTAAFTLGEMSIKSKKGKWIYRSVVVAGHVFLVVHNKRTP